MEQARYWMWAKRKQPDSNPHINLAPISPVVHSYGDSWEEQAFAEDAAAGSLGGCVWPPRSYSCSFCRREFRSAQALGGHMNVHRRDRARMKQLSPISPTLDHQVVVPQNNHALNPCTSFHDSPYNTSHEISTFLYNNPNPRVSSPPSKKINSEEINTSTLSFFSPVVEKNDRDHHIVSSHSTPSWSSFVAGKRKRDSDLIKKDEEIKLARDEKEDCVTEDLSISLNLDFRGTQMNEEVASCKRRRIESSCTQSKDEEVLLNFPKLSAVDRSCVRQSEMFKLRSGPVEELDLELRLGDAPKVK